MKRAVRVPLQLALILLLGGPAATSPAGGRTAQAPAHPPPLSAIGQYHQDLGPAARHSPSVRSLANWHIQRVDSEGDTGGYTSIRVDRQGWPHISYFEFTRSVLRYARLTPAGWHFETADDSGEVGMYTSLALDHLGAPHIAYWDMGAQDLNFTRLWATAWTSETVDAAGNVGASASLALDPSGRPHIVYQNRDATSLRYARLGPAGWTTGTVDNSGDVGAHCSLALDRTGRPHVSYHRTTFPHSGSLKYARPGASGWESQTIESFAAVSAYSSIALDQWDRPTISYQGDGSLKVARFDGTRWTTETIAPGGAYAALVLDAAGRPHVSFLDPDGHLRYAWHNGLAWQVETVDNSTDCAHTSIALDGSGRIHISYQAYATDLETSVLRYAWRTSPAATLTLAKRADPAQGVHNGDTLTITLKVGGSGLNAVLRDPLPPGVAYVPGSLATTLSPAAAYNSASRTIRWSGWLSSDPAGTIQFRVTLESGADPSALAEPFVNIAWLGDAGSPRVVRATVMIGGQRTFLPAVLRTALPPGQAGMRAADP